jgi:CDP-diacylglycerol--glycerol-3-phosphate 3-phosphatidyltransferase
MIALLWLLYWVRPGEVQTREIWQGVSIIHVGEWMLALAAILTLWSGFQYLHAAWPSLRADEIAETKRLTESKTGS